MNTEIIREIALSIVNEALLKNWLFYALFLVVGFLGAYFGSYIKSYAHEKAKNSAIKSDLNAIKLQLKETTLVTEKIKNDLEHDIWRKKTIEATRREKLEEYFNLIFAGIEALHEKMLSAFFKEKNTYDKHALNKADILQKLYFPELSEIHKNFKNTTEDYTRWIANGQMEIVEKMRKGEKYPMPTQKHLDLQQAKQKAINDSATELTEAGKNIAESINA